MCMEYKDKATDTSEDIREVIDRARTDNDVTDPGALQPGKVLMIRIKK